MLKSEIIKLLNDNSIRTRLAPSPTGYLHLGHVLHVLYVAALAKIFSADIVVRIEDHDAMRCKKEYEKEICADLIWLNLLPICAVQKQSAHPERYQRVYEMLVSQGKAYNCSCNRDVIAKRCKKHLQTNEYIYDQYCLGKNIPYAIEKSCTRIYMKNCSAVSYFDLFAGFCTEEPKEYGDFIIKDKKGNFSYQFCVVIDDILEKINLVIRGKDIFHQSSRQLWLRKELGCAETLAFAHHPLLLEKGSSEKLAKRNSSTSLKELRSSGFGRLQIINLALQDFGFAIRNEGKIIEEFADYLLRLHNWS